MSVLPRRPTVARASRLRGARLRGWWFVLTVVAILVGSCASTAPPMEHHRERPIPVVEPKPTAKPVLVAPNLDTTALMSWELARIDALLACAQGKPCSQPAAPSIDDDTVRALLASPPRDASGRQATASAARAFIDNALAPDAFDRHMRRRGIAFVDGAARFAFDDVRVLLNEAKRDQRARILAAARAGLERQVAIAAEERALLNAAATRVGVTRAQLLCRRAGLDEATLRALVARVLSGTEPLLSAVASDATLVNEVRPPVVDVRIGRTLAASTRAAADPILFEAAARAALAPRRGALMADWTRAIAVETRVAALSVTALLDGADADARDVLGSRILSSEVDVVTGAGALLLVDEAGLVIERFIALLSTPGLARDLRAGVKPDGDRGWIRAWQDAPPVEERGYPEAFIEVLKILPELAAE